MTKRQLDNQRKKVKQVKEQKEEQLKEKERLDNQRKGYMIYGKD